MKEKIANRWKKMKPYALPGLITFVLVTVTLIGKGIWPFGSNRIDYFDNMQQVAPLYAHLWDWMHGKASLWLDWYTGMGTNVSMSISAFSMLSPFNLLLFFVPRNMILESISILTVVKMTFMAIAMFAFLHHVFPKLVYPLQVTFAVLYSCCGYVLLYGSCFTPWMDIVAIFPLLMLALIHLFETGRKRFYILMVAACFIINYYLSAMSVIYILVVSGIYILLGCERKKWKEHIWNLGIGTVTGVGLSAFILAPVMVQLSGSQRGSAGTSLLSQYLGWIKGSFVNDGTMGDFQRWMMLYGLSFIVAIIIVGIRRNWSNKRETRYYGALTAVAILPVFVEGVNLIWHFGSYNGYTLRMGFMIAFTLLCVAAHYSESLLPDCPTDLPLLKKQFLIAGLICVGYAIGYRLMPKNNEYIAIAFFMSIFVLLTVYYVRRLLREKEQFQYKRVLALIMVEVFFSIFALIGLPKFYTYEDYQVGDYVEYANEVADNLISESSASDRISNPDISLNANYPLILRRGALSSFTAALQSSTQSSAKSFGYSKYFLWLLDSGGTVFSNALFHITEAVNQNALDPSMYTLENTDGTYSLYSANYQLPFAMNVNSTFLSEDLGSDWTSLQNKFYQALSGDSESLVTGMSYSMKSTDTTQTYMMHAGTNSALYMNIVDVNNRNTDANNSWLISSMHIYVNDQLITIPTLGDVNNTAYFTDYNNNLVYLGTFNDETVNIRIEYDDPWYLKVSEVRMAQLSMDKMQSLCEKYQNYKCDVTYDNTSMSISVNGDATRNVLLVPIISSQDWTVTVNGKKEETTSVAGMFTAVKVPSGACTVTFSFAPKGRTLGILISLGTLVLLAGTLLLKKYRHIHVAGWIKTCAEFLFLEVYNVVVVAMFLIPTLMFLPALIYNIVLKLMKLF